MNDDNSIDIQNTSTNQEIPINTPNPVILETSLSNIIEVNLNSKIPSLEDDEIQNEEENTEKIENVGSLLKEDTIKVGTKEEKKNSTNYILPFKAIHTFIMSMNEEFGNKNKPLRLYARLIEQTTFSHELPIKKHVQAFTNFCVLNRDAIYTKNIDKLHQSKISYSERVYLDIKDVFKLADRDQKVVMWQHILTISALVDTTGRAKQILKDSNDNSKETNFLTDIIEKVEKNVDVENMSNPFDAIGQIMSSGVFTELIGNMNDQVNSGQLDINKMLSAVQGMVSNITKEQPEMSQMIDGIMKNMGNLDLEKMSGKK